MTKTKDDFNVTGWVCVADWVPNQDAISVTYSKPDQFILFSFQISGIKMDTLNKNDVEWERFMTDLQWTLLTLSLFLGKL